MSKSLRPPVPSFTSAKRRRFTVGPGTHEERFPDDTLWTDEFPILYKGKAAGKLFRSLSYGTGPTGEPRWHASTRALYWTYASGAEQAGIGYDVAAFDTARECLTAWGHSADQILDWHQSQGGKGGGKSAARPAAPRKSGRPRRPRVDPVAKAQQPARRSGTPAPASRPRRSRIPAAAIEKAREDHPGKYPLPIAEQKLAGLYDYVKREGGKLPPCGK